MKDFLYLQSKYTVNSYVNRGLTIARGKGVHLYDDKGKKYLDMMSNYGVGVFGYANRKINKALIKQAKLIANLHGSFASAVRAQASQKLVKMCGTSYGKVFWSNSGSEAIEAAIKFAILTTGRYKFVTAKNSFHGKTLGSLSATGIEKYKKNLILLKNFKQVEFNDVSALEKSVDSKTAAVILEPIQGEAGIIEPDGDYLAKVRSICDKRNCLLIIDEIQTGIGRTGYFLAIHTPKVNADMVCLGKGLAGGLPVGATVITKEVADKIPKLSHTSTFGGSPLVCSAVLAVLDNLDSATLTNIRNLGIYFKSQITKIGSNNIVDVRGKGLMIGFKVFKNRNSILKKLQQRGILAIPAGDNVVRFLPPYIITKKDIDTTVDVLRSILR